ncbi:MAG: transposase [Bacteroidales bacterium]|nr:transposase [Bacteroidales bacterium]
MKSPLEYDKCYHIYNRGNNYENIFIDEKDYQHFLKLFDIYIGSVADTYAWCLMKNHFHILVRIKEENEIGYLNSVNANSEDAGIKWETHFVETPGREFVKKPNPTQQFKHFFNSYSRWFNLRHNRRGSLFEKNYERKLVSNQKQLTNLVIYIHNNSVKHGFVGHITEYPWSSYHAAISKEPTKIKRKELISYFDNIENFKFLHNRPSEEDDSSICDLILE